MTLEIICLSLGPPLLPVRAVYARNVFSPRVRILDLLLGLTETGNTGGATSNTCCSNARVFWAWEACWRLHFSGMTSLRRVLGLIMHWRCCLQRFSLIVPCCGCHGLSRPVPPRPCCCTGTSPPWRMKLRCLYLVAAFLLGVSSAACTRLHPYESVLASLRLPAWSPVHSWLLRLRSDSLSAPALLPAPTPVLQRGSPLCACRGHAQAHARLGLA